MGLASRFAPLLNFFLKILFFLSGAALAAGTRSAGESGGDFSMGKWRQSTKFNCGKESFPGDVCINGLVVVIAAGWVFISFIYGSFPGPQAIRKIFWKDPLFPFVILWERCRSALFMYQSFSPRADRGRNLSV